MKETQKVPFELLVSIAEELAGARELLAAMLKAGVDSDEAEKAVSRKEGELAYALKQRDALITSGDMTKEVL